MAYPVCEGADAGVTRGATMRVLVACEYSGRVREAFRARGHDAWSCDLLPSEDGSPFHIQGDVLSVLEGLPSEKYRGEDYRDLSSFDKEKVNQEILLTDIDPWDLMIAHPPCTHLAVSGARHFEAKRADGRQQAALAFVRQLLDAPIPMIALENPISIISSAIRKPDQIIQPWQFGHGETKATCLWLKQLPSLSPTNIVGGREARIHKMPPSPTRWKDRSRTYQGIADAMADQWG